MRGLAILGAGDVGTKRDKHLGSKIRPESTGCINAAHPEKFKKSESGVSSLPPKWDGSKFSGTICGLVGWMGAIHDKMIESTGKDKALLRYIEAESAIIGKYWEHINFNDVLTGISEGTCFTPAAPRGRWQNFPIIVISGCIVAAIAMYLMRGAH